jgi:hypothetical protein
MANTIKTKIQFLLVAHAFCVSDLLQTKGEGAPKEIVKKWEGNKFYNRDMTHLICHQLWFGFIALF